MAEKEISIFIDDSGQLHTNYHSDYFVYGGYWCFNEDSGGISGTYGKLMKSIYKTNKEVKSSKMSGSKKRKVLRRILRDHHGKFNPVFVVAYIPNITIDFENKNAVQLHKNYMLRRLVEDVINSVQKLGVKISKFNVFIDNQSQTNVPNRDKLEIYIENWFRNSGRYLAQTFTKTSATFNVKLMESHRYRAMQIADLIANTKFCRYHNNCTDSKTIYFEFDISPLCRKHPKYFTLA